jgi:hypothetical protein
MVETRDKSLGVEEWMMETWGKRIRMKRGPNLNGNDKNICIK